MDKRNFKKDMFEKILRQITLMRISFYDTDFSIYIFEIFKIQIFDIYWSLMRKIQDRYEASKINVKLKVVILF